MFVGADLWDENPSHLDRWTLPCLLFYRKMFALWALSSIPHLIGKVMDDIQSACDDQ